VSAGGEVDKDQKTEEASPRRREQLREEGKVPRSADVGAAAVLAVASAALWVSAGRTAEDVLAFARRALRMEDAHAPLEALSALVPVGARATLPIAGAAAAAALVAGLVQTRGLFSLALLAPKSERLDPLQQLQNVLPSKQSAIETLKSLAKIAAVGVVAWQVVEGALPTFLGLARVSLGAATGEISGTLTKLLVHAVLCFVALGAIDGWLAWKRFEDDAKMSKQELKDEYKQEEGDPQLKARVRARMREASKRRGVADVKNATVLVVNPTHYAAALRYRAGQDAVPVVLAKGVDQVALAMRAEARKHGVPVIEHRPLARALCGLGKAGKPIPAELYAGVAEIIAHVARLRGGVL
jgi:flagellar biosynthetic protein FlhB